jgi:hypothetical protein
MSNEYVLVSGYEPMSTPILDMFPPKEFTIGDHPEYFVRIKTLPADNPTLSEPSTLFFFIGTS